MGSNTFVALNLHRDVRSTHTRILSLILLSFALAVALPSSAKAMSMFNFTINFDGTNTISGSFTSSATDNWSLGNIDSLQFAVPGNLNGNAVPLTFNSPGFDTADPNHTLNAFQADLAGGITDLSGRISSPSTGTYEIYSWSSSNCNASIQCIFSYRFTPLTEDVGIDTSNTPVSTTISAAPVPEPTTIALFGSGLLALAGTRWYQRRREGTQLR